MRKAFRLVQYQATPITRCSRICFNLDKRRSLFCIHVSYPSGPIVGFFNQPRSLVTVLSYRFHSTYTPMNYLEDLNNDPRTRAFKLCRHHLGGAWRELSKSEMSFFPISGGMSNALYRCALPKTLKLSNGEPYQVLLRLYGDHWQDCDKSTQIEIFRLLSAKGLGPKLYASFDEGRIEEFLPGLPLSFFRMTDREIYCAIAKKLAAIHGFDVNLNKREPWLFNRCTEILKAIKEFPQNPEFNEVTHDSTIEIAKAMMIIDFDREIKLLASILERTLSPLVFSHNDLHHGNILLCDRTKRRPTIDERLVLIDFEYSSYNYRGFDIANHLCEWSFEYDTPNYPHFAFHEDRLPSKEAQSDFLRVYLKQRRRLDCERLARSHDKPINGHTGNYLSPINGSDHQTNGQQAHARLNHTNNGLRGSLISEGDELAMLDEIRPFFMAANLLWSLWCVKSAHTSNIKFGYWEHAMTRWKLYQQFKTAYMRDQKVASHQIATNHKRINREVSAD